MRDPTEAALAAISDALRLNMRRNQELPLTQRIQCAIIEELAEARTADDSTPEAEQRIGKMLTAKFPEISVVGAFSISDPTNFETWSVTVKCTDGGLMLTHPITSSDVWE